MASLEKFDHISYHTLYLMNYSQALILITHALFKNLTQISLVPMLFNFTALWGQLNTVSPKHHLDHV